MFYIKENLNDTTSISVEINNENVYCRCPQCGCSLPSKTQKSDTQNAKNRSDSSDLREPERFFLCNIIF